MRSILLPESKARGAAGQRALGLAGSQAAYRFEFRVILLVDPAGAADGVVRVEEVGVRRVVHDNALAQVPSQQREILHVVPLQPFSGLAQRQHRFPSDQTGTERVSLNERRGAGEGGWSLRPYLVVGAGLAE